MTNLWATVEGRAARREQLGVLAQGKGFLAEFAGNVLAGTVELDAILRLSIVPEDVLDAVHGFAERWTSLPDEEKYVLTHAWEDNVRRTIEALNARPAVRKW
ncbi:hypothetical protein LWC34_47375 [Kibdelosporangium philippinense]|uniref:Uncharacterized protein n=1 Tax=Kibdelosporangium philippinense TaxID=211113 RepID=A0ABS8ZWX5_9PSEU|nr:hypothetical protein [Kibdelosporangium philippinense]MCE7010377.1 hypothetical protein [Kibdelosporangium philippinense]